MASLRTVVVMDYQNIHLTGRNLFASSRYRAVHESLIDPLLYAAELLRVRNRAQRPGYEHAVLSRVLVYRGLPSPEHDPDSYARNLAQQAHWERDVRVRVTHRPLKYEYERDGEGAPVHGPDGKRIVLGKKEKGVDVLCALALVREAANPDVDLAILASQDSDLQPALDEALLLGTAKVETVNWYDPAQRYRCPQLCPEDHTQRLWNTRLGDTEFQRSWDRTLYS
jgi:uncharacterized LabA/DUF88 family protein